MRMYLRIGIALRRDGVEDEEAHERKHDTHLPRQLRGDGEQIVGRAFPFSTAHGIPLDGDYSTCVN
jgi:hypothetical protein